MTIQDLLTAGVGMPAKDLRVTVIQAFPLRTVTTHFGEKQIMDGTVKDATGELRLSWWGPTLQPDQIKGQEVLVTAKPNQQGTLAGAALKQGKDKMGAPRLELVVSGDHITLPPADLSSGQAVPRPATAGRPTEAEVVGFATRVMGRLTEAFLANGTQPSDTALASCVNTLLIAYTEGRINLDVEEVPF